MGLWQKMRAEVAAWRVGRQAMSLHTAERSGDLSAYNALWMRGLEHLAVGDRPIDPFSQVGAVYNAESKISQTLASVEWSVYRGGDRGRRVDAHPLYSLLTHPNDHLIGQQLIEGTAVWMDLWGRAFWHLDAEVRGVPTRIRLLPANRMTSKLKGGELDHWEYQPPTDAMIPLSKDEVIRFAYFDHRDPYGGLSRLSAARLSVNLSWRSTRFQDLFYEKGGMPPFYLSWPAEAQITDAQVKNALELFRQEQMGGLRTAYSVPGMARGGALKSISVNQKDAEWIETQNLTRKDIHAIFDISDGIAGYTADSNYAISASEWRAFLGRSIKGRGELIRAVIQDALMARYFPGDEFVWEWSAKMAELMPEETRASIASMKALWDMGVPATEAAAQVGLRLSTTGRPWLDVGWLPFSVVRADSAMAEPEPAVVEPEPDAESGKSARRRAGIWPASEAARLALWRGYGKRLDALDRRYLGDYRGWLTWLRDTTIDRLKNRAVSPAHRAKDDDAPPGEAAWSKELWERTEATAKASIKAGAQTAMAEIDLDDAFDLLDPRVLSMVLKRRQSVVGAGRTTVKRLREDLAEGIAEGETIDELADRVRARIREAYNGQARVVARTETAAGFSEARFETFRTAEVASQEWLSARDPVVRDSHAAVDGEVVVMGGQFSNGLKFPLDPDGDPGEVINCRCVALPVLA